jgi:hypothetical protein
MHRPLAALALTCLAGASSAAFAVEPSELLKPMSFLAGHCWKGTFPDGKSTDEHCFAWMYGGRALRDTHTVRKPGQPDGLGESTYYVDSAGNHLEFLYIENSGGFSRGTVESLPGALLFPDTQYISDGEALVYRARWTRQGDTAYEAWSEAQTASGWSTMFKLVLRRVD